MKRWLIIYSLLFCIIPVFSQDFIPIWTGSRMPNSKGLNIKDSIANERVYQVGTPGFYVFTPSVAENKGAAVLIIPGGGYARLAYQISGFQLAKWFNTFGVTAFVLNHRLPQSPDVIESHKAPLQDAQQAMKYIRAHASEWNIDVNKVGAMGSSAGAHLAACLSVLTADWTAGTYAGTRFRPDFTILVSPVISMLEYVNTGSRDNLLGKGASSRLLNLFSCNLHVTGETPPTFMVHATDDQAVSSMNSILYYTALKANNVKMSTLHIFPEGGHSIALRNNPGTTNDWTMILEKWMMELNLLDNK